MNPAEDRSRCDDSEALNCGCRESTAIEEALNDPLTIAAAYSRMEVILPSAACRNNTYSWRVASTTSVSSVTWRVSDGTKIDIARLQLEQAAI